MKRLLLNLSTIAIAAGCSDEPDPRIPEPCRVGTVNDCGRCGDDCLAADHVTAAVCDKSGPEPVCLITGCAADFFDVDQNAANGCELACAGDPGATEVCDSTNTDEDCDGVINPEDTDGCVVYFRDADEDGHGLASDSRCLCQPIAPHVVTSNDDCADDAETCIANCGIDNDGDTVPDCRDGCMDGDKDDYGTPGMGPNTCMGPDCQEGEPTCTTDCSTDLDNDLTPDCMDGCVDIDDDGFGTDGGPGLTCGLDCDDTLPTCNSSCANSDTDQYPDCADCAPTNAECDTDCTDSDGDGFCTTTECNDFNPTCTPENACVDGDSDDFCTGADVHDGNPNCTSDSMDNDGDAYCVTHDCKDSNSNCPVAAMCGQGPCLPASLSVLGTPTLNCNPMPIRINLERVTQQAQYITCSSADATIDGPVSFESGTGTYTIATGTSTQAWSGAGFPASCPSTGQFQRFLASQATSRLARGSGLDVRGYESLILHALVGYAGSPAAGSVLEAKACCGTGCTLATFATIANAAGGGTDGCATYNLALPASADNCSRLFVELSWPNVAASAGVDNLSLTGQLMFTPVIETSDNYQSSVTSCVPVSAQISCTWDDGVNTPRSGSTTVTYQ